MKAMVDRKSFLTVKRFVCSTFRFHLSPIYPPSSPLFHSPPLHAAPLCFHFPPPLFPSSFVHLLTFLPRSIPRATPRFDEFGQLVNRKGNECVHRIVEGKVGRTIFFGRLFYTYFSIEGRKFSFLRGNF